MLHIGLNRPVVIFGQYPISNSHKFILNSIHKDLKGWNLNVYGNIDANIKECRKIVEVLDKIGDHRDLYDQEIQQKQEACDMLWRLMKDKEKLWSQKSENGMAKKW